MHCILYFSTMADVHGKSVRSYNMSQIRSRDTKPELLVRKFLFANGFRYRLHVKNLPGKPDIVLPKYKTVILVNGCFWHGHKNCRYFKFPETRAEWWREKIEKNKLRDKTNRSKLKKLKYRVLVVWECQLKNAEKRLNRLICEIKK